MSKSQLCARVGALDCFHLTLVMLQECTSHWRNTASGCMQTIYKRGMQPGWATSPAAEHALHTLDPATDCWAVCCRCMRCVGAVSVSQELTQMQANCTPWPQALLLLLLLLPHASLP